MEGFELNADGECIGELPCGFGEVELEDESCETCGDSCLYCEEPYKCLHCEPGFYLE